MEKAPGEFEESARVGEMLLKFCSAYQTCPIFDVFGNETALIFRNEDLEELAEHIGDGFSEEDVADYSLVAIMPDLN